MNNFIICSDFFLCLLFSACFWANFSLLLCIFHVNSAPADLTRQIHDFNWIFSQTSFMFYYERAQERVYIRSWLPRHSLGKSTPLWLACVHFDKNREYWYSHPQHLNIISVISLRVFLSMDIEDEEITLVDSHVFDIVLCICVMTATHNWLIRAKIHDLCRSLFALFLFIYFYYTVIKVKIPVLLSIFRLANNSLIHFLFCIFL